MNVKGIVSSFNVKTSVIFSSSKIGDSSRKVQSDASGNLEVETVNTLEVVVCTRQYADGSSSPPFTLTYQALVLTSTWHCVMNIRVVVTAGAEVVVLTTPVARKASVMARAVSAVLTAALQVTENSLAMSTVIADVEAAAEHSAAIAVRMLVMADEVVVAMAILAESCAELVTATFNSEVSAYTVQVALNSISELVRRFANLVDVLMPADAESITVLLIVGALVLVTTEHPAARYSLLCNAANAVLVVIEHAAVNPVFATVIAGREVVVTSEQDGLNSEKFTRSVKSVEVMITAEYGTPPLTLVLLFSMAALLVVEILM